MAKLTFTSRNHDLNVFAISAARCEKALREYLGITHGALEKSERANAEIYSVSEDIDGSNERLEICATDLIEGEVLRYVLDTEPLAKYIGAPSPGALLRAVNSDAQKNAARENGKKGGRPKKQK